MSNSVSTRQAARMNRRPARTNAGWPLAGAELALTGVTLSVVYGLSRLFADNGYARGAVVAAVGAHLVASVTRRIGLGTMTSLATSLVAMVFALAATLYQETTSYLVPTATTWSAVGDDLSQSWTAFSVVKAPTEVLPGFALAIAVTMWLIATVADLAAFRVRTVVEALVPATTLFVFTAMLGQPSGRVSSTAVFLAAVAAFLVFIRVSFPLNTSIPIESTRSRQPRALLQTGLSMAGIAVVLGLVFGPLLPGVDQAAVIDWKNLDGGSGGSRVTLSPLVDARGRLVEQTDVELFRVSTTSETGAYWRTTALDTFDGAIWGSSSTYTEARGTLAVPDPDVRVETIETTFTVSNLGDIWFPAPFEPVSFTGANAKWDGESSTLVTQTGEFTTGITYTVTSAIPLFEPATLRLASSFVPREITERYTALPADFSTRVQDLAIELTQSAPSPYDKAIALQSFFLSDFRYTTDVPIGHDLNRIEQFLFVDQAGYCEQFAGTYAAMARAAGLPARVAIGFTPGDRVGDEFVVRGRNYHAWPEVWIDGVWVSFEPTPGRGSPQSEQWTGVAPQQDTRRDLLIEEEFNDEPAVTDFEAFDPTFDDQVPDLNLTDDLDGGLGAGSGGVPQWIQIAAIVAVIMSAASAAWWFGIPVLERRLRVSRRAREIGERSRVSHAWEDLTEALTVIGLGPVNAETRSEYISRVGPRSSLDTDTLTTVATLTDQASYSAADVDDAISAEAIRLVAEIELVLEGRASQSDRARRRMNPGRLVREFRRR